MKKVHLNKGQIAKILVAILCIAGLSSFLVYYFTPQPLVPLTQEQEMEVKESYIANIRPNSGLTIDQLYIEHYFGTYNDCIVANVSIKDVAMAYGGDLSDWVAGCKFIFPTYYLLIYRDGEYNSIKGAYKDGWISFKDVKDIHYYYNNQNIL